VRDLDLPTFSVYVDQVTIQALRPSPTRGVWEVTPRPWGVTTCVRAQLDGRVVGVLLEVATDEARLLAALLLVAADIATRYPRLDEPGAPAEPPAADSAHVDRRRGQAERRIGGGVSSDHDWLDVVTFGRVVQLTVPFLAMDGADLSLDADLSAESARSLAARLVSVACLASRHEADQDEQPRRMMT
jgi:hypothetical protein